MTHPGTTAHTHIIFSRDGIEEELTGHIKSSGIAAGSTIRFAAN
jgi:hypothetical protein